MRKIAAYVAVAAVAANLLSGCAAMFHGTTQQISVRSNVPGTVFFANEAYVGKDNGITVFHKNESYVLRAHKDGCADTTLPASKSFDAITLLGVFIDFGIITILIVDGAATGSWQQFDQTSYVLDPQCSSS